MTSIYKYMKLEYLKDAIECGIYASRIDEVNDPYEFEGIKKTENFRICTLTNSPKAMLMWAHYGDSHRGCCVEFYVDSNHEGLIHKIKYDKHFTKHKYLTEKQLEKCLFIKGNEWDYENEYRAVYYKKNKNSDVWKEYDKKIFLDFKVKTIIFGCLSERNENYKKSINLIKENNFDNKIEVKKMMLSDERYELVYDPQFNYLDE